MIITNEGRPSDAHWWAGAEIRCTACGLEATLEANDHQSVFWMGHDKNAARLGCPSCETPIDVLRSEP